MKVYIFIYVYVYICKLYHKPISKPIYMQNPVCACMSDTE